MKYTMFKSQILARSIQGYLETEAFWKNSVEQKRLLQEEESDKNHRKNLSEANQQIQAINPKN